MRLPVRRPRLRQAAIIVLAAIVAVAPITAEAQKRRASVIRDAEIEKLLRDYAKPIFEAAGIGSGGAQIVILNDSDFNAFVASGSRMFINTGTLLEADTPNEVIGVIAHETGHLAGGHLQTLRNEMARAQAIGAISTLLSAGAVAAGALSGSGSVARAGAAASSMGPTIAIRSLLSYRREQEISADRAALSYLNATGQSAAGMIRTFRRFADQQLFAKQYVDPYIQSHPMASERIAQLENAASRSPNWDKKDSARMQLRHQMMRAKLSGFLEGPQAVARRFPQSDKSLPATYARAISAYRSGAIRRAIAGVDALIGAAPDYAYFHELKGQILLESGRAQDAVSPLRRAVALEPRAGLIRIMLGQALLGTGDASVLNEAVANLRAGLSSEPLASAGHRHLAIALQRQGNVAEAELATAQGLLIEGEVESAKTFAARAQAKLNPGTPGWLSADDIINYKMPDET